MRCRLAESEFSQRLAEIASGDLKRSELADPAEASTTADSQSVELNPAIHYDIDELHEHLANCFRVRKQQQARDAPRRRKVFKYFNIYAKF